MRNSLWCYYVYRYVIKANVILFKLFWYKALKIEITQFPDGFCLKLI